MWQVFKIILWEEGGAWDLFVLKVVTIAKTIYTNGQGLEEKRDQWGKKKELVT